MSYKYSTGPQVIGDLKAKDDTQRDTQIDFGEDYIGFETSGSAVMVVSGSRVGIGTTTPDYDLDVAGNVGVNQYIYHNGDGNTWINFTDNRIRLNAGGNNFIDCEDPGSAPHKVRINNGGNNIDFVIKNNSNNVYFTADASTSRVGIGTDTPDESLHVAGNIKVSGDDARIKINGDTDSHPGLELYENGTRKWIIFNDYTNDNLTFKTDSNVRMSIEQGGNVGIGTEDPSAKLHLSSTTTDDLLFLETTEDSNTASPVIKLKRNSGSPANADYLGQLKFQGENDADQNVTYAKITGKIGSVTDGSEQGIIEFANMKNGSSGITARLRHDSLQLLNSTNLTVDGSLGVGTTSPDYELHVVGAIKNTGAVYRKTREVTSFPYTVANDDYVILVAGSGSPRVIDLPAKASHEGRILIIKDATGNAQSNNIELRPNGSENIDGSSDKLLGTNRIAVTIVCASDQWHIIGQH